MSYHNKNVDGRIMEHLVVGDPPPPKKKKVKVCIDVKVFRVRVNTTSGFYVTWTLHFASHTYVRSLNIDMTLKHFILGVKLNI